VIEAPHGRVRGPLRRFAPEQLEWAIYGILVVTAVVVAESLDPEISAYAGAESVVVTTLIFWVAHTYARSMALRLEKRRRLTWREVGGVAAVEWPLVEAGLLPAILLALGGLGLYSRGWAFGLAMWVGVAQLFLWGVAFARREEAGRLGTVMAGTFNALLGLAIISLKAFH
jgi:hypothetical protein